MDNTSPVPPSQPFDQINATQPAYAAAPVPPPTPSGATTTVVKTGTGAWKWIVGVVGVVAVAAGGFFAYASLVFSDVELSMKERCELNAFANALMYRGGDKDFNGTWDVNARIDTALYMNHYAYENGCGGGDPEFDMEYTYDHSDYSVSLSSVDTLSRKYFGEGVTEADAANYQAVFNGRFDMRYESGNFVGSRLPYDSDKKADPLYTIGIVDSLQKTISGTYKLDFTYYNVPAQMLEDVYYIYPRLTNEQIQQTGLVNRAGTVTAVYSYADSDAKKEPQFESFDRVDDSSSIQAKELADTENETAMQWLNNYANPRWNAFNVWNPLSTHVSAHSQLHILASMGYMTEAGLHPSEVPFPNGHDFTVELPIAAVNDYAQRVFGTQITGDGIEEAVSFNRQVSRMDESAFVHGETMTFHNGHFEPLTEESQANMTDYSISRVDMLPNNHIRIFVDSYGATWADGRYDTDNKTKEDKSYVYDILYHGENPFDTGQWQLRGLVFCDDTKSGDNCGL